MDYQLTSEIIGGITSLALVTGLGISNRRKGAKEAAATEKYAKLKAEFDALTKDNETFTEALSLAKDAVGSLEQQLAEATQGKNTLTKKLAAATQLETQLTEQQQRTEAAQRELEAVTKAKTRISEQLATETATATGKIATLEKELKAQTQAVTAARSQLETLQAELTAAQQAQADQTSLVQKAEQEAEQKVQKALGELEQQVAKLTENKTALEKTIENSRSEQTKLKAQIDELTAECDRLKNAQPSDQSTSDNPTPTPDLTAELQQLKQARNHAQQTAEAAQATVAAREKTIETLKSDKAALEEAMQISQQAILALQQQSAQAPKNPSAKAPKQETATAKKSDKATAAKPAPSDAAQSAPVESTPAKDTKAGAITNKTFVITGKLTQVTNEQLTAAIEESGGRINKMPSAKTDYIVVGENPGNKLKKAEKCGVTQLTETDMLALLEAN